MGIVELKVKSNGEFIEVISLRKEDFDNLSKLEEFQDALRKPVHYKNNLYTTGRIEVEDVSKIDVTEVEFDYFPFGGLVEHFADNQIELAGYIDLVRVK